MAPLLDHQSPVDVPVSFDNSSNGKGNKSCKSDVELYTNYVRGGFQTFPIIWDRAYGHTIIDVDGKEFIDMISQFAVTNFGHSHPKIISAVVDQVQKVALVNTSYIHPLYTRLAERLCKKFGYDRIASMVTGSEAVESCVKIARKWAYVVKKVPEDQAFILTADTCYHGVTLATMSLSNVMASNFGKHIPNVGPYSPGSGHLVRFGCAEDLEKAFIESGSRIAAFMLEPLQGLAGTIEPPRGYLKAVQDLCEKHNVLFICDEIQTGFGRTGTDLAFQYEPDVKPDLVTLGKAITGGVVPMSIIMGKAHVMDVIDIYEVASTYAAAPVACAAAHAALDILEEGNISRRAQQMGDVLTRSIEKAKLPYLLDHRGTRRGLFQTLVIDESMPGVSARAIAALCAQRGMLCGNTKNRLRFSPPLTISEEALQRAVDVLASAFSDVATAGDFPGKDPLR